VEEDECLNGDFILEALNIRRLIGSPRRDFRKESPGKKDMAPEHAGEKGHKEDQEHRALKQALAPGQGTSPMWYTCHSVSLLQLR
jgi:hypothetical protein